MDSTFHLLDLDAGETTPKGVPADVRSRRGENKPVPTRLLVAFAACIAAVAACESSTEIPGSLHFVGVMNGTKEKPTATTSTATGQAVVVLFSTGIMSFSVTWTGLTGAATGAHVHGPADSNNTAGVLIDFSALPAGSATITLTADGGATGNVNVKGTAVVTATVSGDSLVKLLNAGLLYVNVHTAANANGEIRTQLKKQ